LEKRSGQRNSKDTPERKKANRKPKRTHLCRGPLVNGSKKGGTILSPVEPFTKKTTTLPTNGKSRNLEWKHQNEGLCREAAQGKRDDHCDCKKGVSVSLGGGTDRKSSIQSEQGLRKGKDLTGQRREPANGDRKGKSEKGGAGTGKKRKKSQLVCAVGQKKVAYRRKVMGGVGNGTGPV